MLMYSHSLCSLKDRVTGEKFWKGTCNGSRDSENVRARIIDHYYYCNHNYKKVRKSDWLSTTLILALIEQFNWTVRVMPK